MKDLAIETLDRELDMIGDNKTTKVTKIINDFTDIITEYPDITVEEVTNIINKVKEGFNKIKAISEEYDLSLPYLEESRNITRMLNKINGLKHCYVDIQGIWSDIEAITKQVNDNRIISHCHMKRKCNINKLNKKVLVCSSGSYDESIRHTERISKEYNLGLTIKKEYQNGRVDYNIGNYDRFIELFINRTNKETKDLFSEFLASPGILKEYKESKDKDRFRYSNLFYTISKSKKISHKYIDWTYIKLSLQLNKELIEQLIKDL